MRRLWQLIRGSLAKKLHVMETDQEYLARRYREEDQENAERDLAAFESFASNGLEWAKGGCVGEMPSPPVFSFRNGVAHDDQT